MVSIGGWNARSNAGFTVVNFVVVIFVVFVVVLNIVVVEVDELLVDVVEVDVDVVNVVGNVEEVVVEGKVEVLHEGVWDNVVRIFLFVTVGKTVDDVMSCVDGPISLPSKSGPAERKNSL